MTSTFHLERRRTILLFEDDLRNRATTARLLEGLGFEVGEADGWREAIASYVSSPSVGDLVLTD